ncbi:MAG: SMI1/KNR4 family protein [Clostridiales bacterium]|nr:SMI1/KNR4 family protein [Clostridiales bacterium]
MNKLEYKSFMKNFFEKYYAKLLEYSVDAVTLPEVPEEMWVDGTDPEEEWQQWKLIPATISDEEIASLERNWGIEFPEMMKCFLNTYFHLFDSPIGRHSVDNPFEALNNAWNPVLVKAGYLPFTWDQEGYFIRCIDLCNMPNEEKCSVCQIDHEILFDFDESNKISREEIESKMEKLADNFLEYLEQFLN